MSDSENQKFCKKCNEPTSWYSYVHLECAKCSMERNNEESEPLKDSKYIKPDDRMYRRYICHNCRYLQWHPLTYCPRCTGKFSQETITMREVLEKYGDYKQGY